MPSRRVPVAGAGFIEPCLPSPAREPPSGPGWLHEVKHDGYRMVARRDGEHLRLLSRRGLDWADRFPAIVTAIEALAIRSCTIDDEAIACDSNGPADFQLLRRGRAKDESLLVAFDLLNSTAAIFGVSRSRRGKRSWRGS